MGLEGGHLYIIPMFRGKTAETYLAFESKALLVAVPSEADTQDLGPSTGELVLSGS